MGLYFKIGGYNSLTFESSLIFIMSLILLWIKPGPGQALKIARAMNDGFWPAFAIVIGVITACEIFFLAAVLGLEVISNFFDSSGFILKFLGAIYLFYIGYKGLSNIEKGVFKPQNTSTPKRNFFENYFAALILTLANPLPIFYFLGMMPTLVPVGDFTTQDILIGMGIIAFVGLQVDVLLIGLVTQVKIALSDTKFVRRINLFSSMGFIILGAFFLYSALFLENFSFEL